MRRRALGLAIVVASSCHAEISCNFASANAFSTAVPLRRAPGLFQGKNTVKLAHDCASMHSPDICYPPPQLGCLTENSFLLLSGGALGKLKMHNQADVVPVMERLRGGESLAAKLAELGQVRARLRDF